MNVSGYGLNQNYYQANKQQDYVDKNTKVSLEVNEEKTKETQEEQKKLSEKPDKNSSKPKTANELDPAEKKLVQELKARDAEVRAHEAAHLAAAGSLAAGGASYTYQQGPDGKQYAIGGEVPIRIASGDTPEQTIANMQQVKAAATAPSDPSPQDMKIAATAVLLEMKARSELAKERKEEIETKQEDLGIKDEKKQKNPYEKELQSLKNINKQNANYKAFDMSA